MAIMACVQVQNLSFSYGNKPILHDVSLTVEKGEILCVLGPNGSGKSTLVDNILGFLKSKQGEIIIDGRELSAYKRHELAQKIAYVGQNHDVTFPYSVLEIVTMGRTGYTNFNGQPKQQDIDIAVQAIEMMGLSAYINQPYTQLSGGEIKLVMLARAIAQETEIIIMDEPTAHLDLKNELIFLQMVKSLIQTKNVSVIMTTHKPEQAFYFESFGLKITATLLSHGHIVAMGTPTAIITEKTIANTYGVKAKILSQTEEDKTIKSIFLENALV